MVKKQEIKLFENQKVRSVWDSKEEKWYFSIVDIIGVLTDSADPKRYWSDLKRKLKREGNETYEKIVRLKLRAVDGKDRLTDVADQEQLFRIIQSIPSPKAEPFKLWMAQVASQRIDQIQDPELSINQAIIDYERMGYSAPWINQRIKSIEVRKELTDEWKARGMGKYYATLTDVVTKAWSGITTSQYKVVKGLHKENLRDNMTNVELALNMLAEASTTELSKEKKPVGLSQNIKVAKEGGSVAKAARIQLEQNLGRPVVTSEKASDYITPKDEQELLE